MHRTTVNPDTLLQGTFVGMHPGIGRQQGWMNIDQFSQIAIHKVVCQNTHEACQHNKIGRIGIDHLCQSLVEAGTVGVVTVRNHLSLNAVQLGNRQSASISLVADDGGDARGPALGGAGLHHRAHVAAAAGEQEDDVLHEAAQCTGRGDNAPMSAPVLMVLASLLFAGMGVCVKLASAQFNTGEIVFWRGVIGMLFVLSLVRLRGGTLRTTVPLMHLTRAGVGVTALMLWFWSMSQLPLATAVTLNYMSSVWMALFLIGGAVLLGASRVDLRLVATVMAGFAGVALVLQPSLAPGQAAGALAERFTRELGRRIRDANVFIVQPPTVRGLGGSAGIQLFLQDLGGLGQEQLVEARERLIELANERPELSRTRTNSLTETPQLQIAIDDHKAGVLGVAPNVINETMSIALGGAYVNDFIDRGRVKRVLVQGDAAFRADPDAIKHWYVRNSSGQMVSFSAFASSSWINGPRQLVRYNGYPTMRIAGEPAPGVSSGAAIAVTILQQK